MFDSLKLKIPVIQAPMAGSDNAAFVAAASNAGILGSLGAQYRTPAEISTVTAEIKKLTTKPFAVNIFALPELAPPAVPTINEATIALTQFYKSFNLAPPTAESVQSVIDAEAQLNAIYKAEVPVVSFTLGILSQKWIQKFKSANTLVIGTATNIHEALALEEAGVDAITAQSTEAGGHRGTFIGKMEDSLIGGFALIPQLVSAVKIPVIAAGGIMDGRGIVAALSLGARGVQMGTAFLTTKECPIHLNNKHAIQNHNADDTVITKVFSGGAARGIKNEFIGAMSSAPLLAFPFQNALTKPIRKAANEQGKVEFTNLWSGQNGRLARQVSIEELVSQLIEESKQTSIQLTKLLT